jgi:hypothetical protein
MIVGCVRLTKNGTFDKTFLCFCALSNKVTFPTFNALGRRAKISTELEDLVQVLQLGLRIIFDSFCRSELGGIYTYTKDNGCFLRSSYLSSMRNRATRRGVVLCARRFASTGEVSSSLYLLQRTNVNDLSLGT